MRKAVALLWLAAVAPSAAQATPTCDDLAGRADARVQLNKWCYEVSKNVAGGCNAWATTNNGNTVLCQEPSEGSNCAFAPTITGCAEATTSSDLSCSRLSGRANAQTHVNGWCWDLLSAISGGCDAWATVNGGNGNTVLCQTGTGSNCAAGTVFGPCDNARHYPAIPDWCDGSPTLDTPTCADAVAKWGCGGTCAQREPNPHPPHPSPPTLLLLLPSTTPPPPPIIHAHHLHPPTHLAC